MDFKGIGKSTNLIPFWNSFHYKKKTSNKKQQSWINILNLEMEKKSVTQYAEYVLRWFCNF